jgi:DNA-binding transcriptional ArsR family regulator
MVADGPAPIANLDRMFRALSDATRRDIVRRTLQGEVSISALAADYAMSFAAVQKHVAVLEAAGLVRKTATGRERRVRAAPDELARARRYLEQLEALWRHRLDALDAVLAASPTTEKE